MQKTSEKFQNNRWKTVRGVAPTRYPVYFHLKSYGMTNDKRTGQIQYSPTLSKQGYNYRHFKQVHESFSAVFQSYRNDPKFSNRQVRANSADPDQTAPSLIRVYIVCNSGCIFWVHYSLVKPSCSNFRMITANFWGVRILRIFTVMWEW